MAKILTITDFGASGSGYRSIASNICKGLSALGHDIKVLGLEYKGEQHNFDFGIVPVKDFVEIGRVVTVITNEWHQDIVLVILDIPQQIACLDMFKMPPFKYFGIMPVESDPLMFPWAMRMMEMDKVFIISQFGTDEAVKMGVPAEHIRIGIDTEAWRPPTAEEKSMLRNSFGFDDDTFVVLTVADNQERKNIPRAMEIVSDLCKKYPDKDIQHIIKTKPRYGIGWDLDDYSRTIGYNKNYRKIDKPLNFMKLWSYYAVSNVMLHTSKCEGLCIPLLEAMATGVYPIATNCTAIVELLADERGYLIDYTKVEPDYTDPYGNSKRYFAKRSHGLELLEAAMLNTPKTNREYVEGRKWDIAVNQINDAIEILKLS